jgi:hypothetical protein
MISLVRSSRVGSRATLGPVAVTLLFLPALSGADEVHLASGGVVRGVIVDSSDRAVVLETGPGRVALPRSRITRIVESRSTLAAFQERAAGVAPGDVAGLARLARWAAEHDLATRARETWRRVLALDPEHPEANAALHRVSVDGVWMDKADGYRARGYVPYRGRWVTPEEHEALVREQAMEERAAREAALRVREAEARAREAEARAREAEALADQAQDPVEGIPYWWVLAAGGGPFWPGYAPHPPLVRPGHPKVNPHWFPRGHLRTPGPRSDRTSSGRIQGEPRTPPAPGRLSPLRPAPAGSTGTIRSGGSGRSRVER